MSLVGPAVKQAELQTETGSTLPLTSLEFDRRPSPLGYKYFTCASMDYKK